MRRLRTWWRNHFHWAYGLNTELQRLKHGDRELQDYRSTTHGDDW